jgi:hypothetical protein
MKGPATRDRAPGTLDRVSASRPVPGNYPIALPPQRSSAPRGLVVIALLAVTVAAISVAILAWIAIGTSRHVNHVVDKANRVADDASRSVRRLDRTTRDLDPAVRSLRQAADSLRRAGSTTP